jgi:AcrR family transcriptional regulator
MPGGRRARRPLNAERIAAAALRLLDRQGLADFSMHKLGAALGCEAMSIYHHFRGRGEVLDSVAGLLMAEIEVPDAGLGWKERLRRLAHSYRRIALRHPRSFSLLATRPINRPEGLALVDASAAVFRAAGFDVPTTGRLVLLFACWCNGALLAEIAGTAARPDASPVEATKLLAVAAQRFPAVVELAPYMSLANFGPAFDFGVEALIRLVGSMAR